jgi:glycosyltransferase involved in cell wall biosynthesis
VFGSDFGVRGRLMRMDASVVIPTYNRGRLLGVCLDCLIAQDYPKDGYEIIVVDDGSTDGTERVVRERESICRVKYLRQTRTLGNGAAKNRGIAEAEGEIVIFTDSDAFAPPWYVREHVRSHRTHPHSIADGPAISMHDDRRISNPPVGSKTIRILAAMDFWGEEFVNANASCGRCDLMKAGGFDESFLKWQDLELGRRLRKMGLGRVRNRRAYVLHYEAGRRDLPELARHMRLNGKYAALFYEKHPSAWARRKTRLRYLAYDRLFGRLGCTESYLTQDRLMRCRKAGSPWYPLLRRLYLIHVYAEGLKKGFDLRRLEAVRD